MIKFLLDQALYSNTEALELGQLFMLSLDQSLNDQVALQYPEPLIHFALVCGNRSGPALRCYSPGNIDKELMEAARDFLRGGLIVDLNAKVVYATKILKWYVVLVSEVPELYLCIILPSRTFTVFLKGV